MINNMYLWETFFLKLKAAVQGQDVQCFWANV